MELYMIKKSLQIFLHFLPLLPFGAIYKKTLAASVHPQNSSAKISPTRDSNVVKPPREGGTSTLPAGELTSVQINARTIAKVPSSVGAAGNRHKNIRNPLQSIDTTLKATRKGRCHCSEKKKKPTKIPPPLQFESVCFSSGTKVSWFSRVVHQFDARKAASDRAKASCCGATTSVAAWNVLQCFARKLDSWNIDPLADPAYFSVSSSWTNLCPFEEKH